MYYVLDTRVCKPGGSNFGPERFPVELEALGLLGDDFGFGLSAVTDRDWPSHTPMHRMRFCEIGIVYNSACCRKTARTRGKAISESRKAATATAVDGQNPALPIIRNIP